MVTLRPVCFVFKSPRAPRHLLFGKGHPMRKLKISNIAFQGDKGNDQGHGDNRLREVSGLNTSNNDSTIEISKSLTTFTRVNSL